MIADDGRPMGGFRSRSDVKEAAYQEKDPAACGRRVFGQILGNLEP
jgi:hypothetical protein